MDTAIEPAGRAGRKPVHAPGLPRAQSLTRAAALVRAVGEASAGGGGATTAALARACGLPVATAARLLATLSDEGFVERTPDGAAWTLGLPLVRLARAADPDRALVAAGRPPRTGASGSSRVESRSRGRRSCSRSVSRCRSRGSWRSAPAAGTTSSSRGSTGPARPASTISRTISRTSPRRRLARRSATCSFRRSRRWRRSGARAALVRTMMLLMLMVAPLAIGLGAIPLGLVEAFFDPRWTKRRRCSRCSRSSPSCGRSSWIGGAYLQVLNRPRHHGL